MVLTEKERVALAYLNMGRMEATARMIGEDLAAHGLCGGGYQAVGSGVVGTLRAKGFIYFLDDLSAWRITNAGRDALHQS